MLIFSAIWK